MSDDEKYISEEAKQAIKLLLDKMAAHLDEAIKELDKAMLIDAKKRKEQQDNESEEQHGDH